MGVSKEAKSKLRGFEDNFFLWLEEIKSTKKRRLKRSSKKYYRGFRLNSLTIYEGDCVLINIGTCFGGEEKFEIARILECYYEENDYAQGFVKVQWYTQLSDIRKSHLKSIPAGIPSIEDHLDVARDMWSYDVSVDVETIFNHCCVVEVNAMIPPSTVQRPPNALGPLFVCRFKYLKSNPWLLPLTEDDIIMENNNKLVSTLKEATTSPKRCEVSLVNLKESSPESVEKHLSLSANKLKQKEQISDSPKRKRVKRKLLDPDENQENTFKKSRIQNSSELSKEIVETFGKLKEHSNSSLIKRSFNENNKIDAKTLGQYRGLHLTEISNLLSDEEDQEDHFKGTVKTRRPKPRERKGEETGKSSRRSSALASLSNDQKKLKSEKKFQNGGSEEEEEVYLSPRRISKPTEKLKDYYSDFVERKSTRFSKSPQKEKLAEESIAQKSKRFENKVEIKESILHKSKKPNKRESEIQVNELHESKKVPKEEKIRKSIASESKRQRKNLGNIETKEASHKQFKETKSFPKDPDLTSDCTSTKSRRTLEENAAETPEKASRKFKKLSPSWKLPGRNSPLSKRRTEFEEARAQLHVSAVPSFLPCREEEFHQIYSFVEGKLLDSTGGCMYVSGVPGTGKTATVREVVRLLQECEKDGTVPSFHFLEMNAMKLTKPNQLWVQIWEGLTHQRVTPDHAYALFEKSLSAKVPKRKSTFILLDELDLLWTRKQDVMYNLFDLSSRVDSRLIVVTIANTMDLPERMMISRVSSRLGLTRMTFQPYTYKQLEEIISSRLMGIKAFDPDAIQLVARKVAAVSGDARRALDVCRRATELAEIKKNELLSSPLKSPKKLKVLVGMMHVSEAIDEMFSSPKIKAIKCCSEIDRYILQAILMEFTRTGIEEAVLNRVFEHLGSICRFEGINPPSLSETLKSINGLSSQKILLTEHSRLDLLLRIRLNISSDDVSYALSAS